MKKIICFTISLCFICCKDSNSLGSDFFYLTDYDALDVGYPYGSIIYKSKQKNHFKEIFIYSDIKLTNCDNQYVIVKQEPNKSLMIKRIKDDYAFWGGYYSNNKKKDSLVSLLHKKMFLKDIYNLLKVKKVEIIADSIFNNEIFYKKIFINQENYYVIQKTNDSIFGPLSLKEFEILKSKRKIGIDFE